MAYPALIAAFGFDAPQSERGKILFHRRPISDADDSRLWGNIIVQNNGCWSWSGGIDKGYGKAFVGGVQTGVHRHVAVQKWGSLKPDQYVDHMCRNTLCSNPSHLRIVTPRVNVLENSSSCSALNLAKTHCIRGHPFNEENTRYTPDGRRDCAECCRIRSKARWNKHKDVFNEKRREDRSKKNAHVTREERRMRRRLPALRVRPDDFSQVAVGKSLTELRRHYTAKPDVIKRWAEETEIELRPRNAAKLAHRAAAQLGLLRKSVRS